jgi:hypothetical protein
MAHTCLAQHFEEVDFRRVTPKSHRSAAQPSIEFCGQLLDMTLTKCAHEDRDVKRRDCH